MNATDSAAAYIQLFEQLDLNQLDGLENFTSADIRFKDPFNDVRGRDAFRRLLKKTLDDVENPKFWISHQAWTNGVLFLRWSFQGRLRRLGNWHVEGMSEIRFDDQGLVCEHIDHWDASEQFYEKLPVIGSLIRLIRRRLTIS